MHGFMQIHTHTQHAHTPYAYTTHRKMDEGRNEGRKKGRKEGEKEVPGILVKASVTMSEAVSLTVQPGVHDSRYGLWSSEQTPCQT